MRQLLQSECEWFGHQIGLCSSPIEQRFLTALLFLTDMVFTPVEDREFAIAIDRGAKIELLAQVPVDNFRIDFVLATKFRHQFAIELDGFTYHGSTPEQFTYDSARQRVISGRGYTVLRFSGQELDRDPVRVAREALQPVLAAVATHDGVDPIEPISRLSSGERMKAEWEASDFEACMLRRREDLAKTYTNKERKR